MTFAAADHSVSKPISIYQVNNSVVTSLQFITYSVRCPTRSQALVGLLPVIKANLELRANRADLGRRYPGVYRAPAPDFSDLGWSPPEHAGLLHYRSTR